MIAREHVIGRFLEGRPHPSRPSGIAAMLVTVPMIVSGYTLEVLTGAGARKAFAIARYMYSRIERFAPVLKNETAPL